MLHGGTVLEQAKECRGTRGYSIGSKEVHEAVRKGHKGTSCEGGGAMRERE